MLAADQLLKSYLHTGAGFLALLGVSHAAYLAYKVTPKEEKKSDFPASAAADPHAMKPREPG